MPATLEAPVSTRPSVRVLDERPVRRASPGRPARATSPARSRTGEFLATFNLEKAFTLLGISVATFLVLVFGADLIFGWPFLQASLLFDVAFVTCGLALGYLSCSVLRDQLRGLRSRQGRTYSGDRLN